MNPVDLIASRHKELRKAREEIGKVQAALDRERARLTELQAGIAAAEQRDRKALGDAIVSGSPDPASESDALRADVEQQQRRIDALLAALSHTQQNVAEVVRQNAWSRDQMREVEKARLRYAAAIEELERARDVFADETGALAWLFDPEGGQSSPINAVLAGRTGDLRGRPPLQMGKVLDELRADLAQVADWVISRHDEPPRPRLELTHREEWAS